jgi:hypothetical protein
VELRRERGGGGLGGYRVLRGARVEGSGGEASPQQDAPSEALAQPGEQAGHAHGLFLRVPVQRRRRDGPVVAEQAFGRRRTFRHEGVGVAKLLHETPASTDGRHRIGLT